MVTRNFKNLLAVVLQAGSNIGNLSIRTITGQTRYLSGAFSFPRSPSTAVTVNAAAAGFSVGTGNTPATEFDWQLEAPLTAGISLALTETSCGVEEGGVPFTQYNITVTNTGSEEVRVREICWKQNVGAARYPGMSISPENVVIMLDRTVLDVPVVIGPGDAGIVTYRLRTIPTPARTVEGVPMVSFEYGTDAQIAAILDAAAAGTIDLQRDAGWRVGDMRRISLAAFTGGNSVTNAAEDNVIVITSFEEYMGCGNVLQFDFAATTATKFRLNSTNTTLGGYASSEMKNVTLPAMAEALPAWLRTRLKTFSVLASAGKDDLTTILTVPDNKLALRSEVEIFGAVSQSYPGEGAQVQYYKAAANRTKQTGLGGSNTAWWERSPHLSNNYCCVHMAGETDSSNASNNNGLAPFGCI